MKNRCGHHNCGIQTVAATIRALRRVPHRDAPVHQGPEIRDPFRILVSCIISQRTKDAQTHAVSRTLFRAAPTPRKIAALPLPKLSRLLRGAGFYNQKARHIRRVAAAVAAGGMPRTREGLMALPGVGRKTANIVLTHAYGRAAIAVDVHVHRISNRLGWVRTRTPEQTEEALMGIVPRRQWRGLNELLVAHGQMVCRPVGPRCGFCSVESRCRKVGVG